MAPASQSYQETDKFLEMLNPIRDLAKNWEVDIAFHLEEYLAELQTMPVTFNDGQTTMNFAQAALIIQGSTCVYSKKVDFLYNLVMQLLDIIHTKKAQRAAVQNDILQRTSDDSEQFLELDDISFPKTGELKDGDFLASRVSLLLPVVPFGIYSQSADDKRNVVLKSISDEILGKKNDFFLNSMELLRSGAAVRHNLEIVGDDVFHVQPRQSISQSFEVEKRCSSPYEDDADDRNDNEFPLQDEPSLVNPVRFSDKTSNEPILQKKTSIPLSNIEKALQTLKKVDSHEDNDTKRKLIDVAPRRTLRVIKQFENVESLRMTRIRKKKVVVSGKLKTTPVYKFIDEALFSSSPKFSEKISCPSFHDKFHEEFNRRKIIFQEMRSRLKNDIACSEDMEIDIKSADEEDNADFGDDNYFDDGNGSTNGDCLFPPLHSDRNEDNTDGSRPKDNLNDLNSTATFEEIIRKHTEAFIKTTHETARMSAISRRVKKWENSLSPLLKEEESRPLFDIHDCSRQVLQKFAPNRRKQTISFSQVVSGEPTYKLAQLFLATLQLANNYKIEINCNDGDNSKKINEMDITLLFHNRSSGDMVIDS